MKNLFWKSCGNTKSWEPKQYWKTTEVKNWLPNTEIYNKATVATTVLSARTVKPIKNQKSQEADPYTVTYDKGNTACSEQRQFFQNIVSSHLHTSKGEKCTFTLHLTQCKCTTEILQVRFKSTTIKGESQ